MRVYQVLTILRIIAKKYVQHVQGEVTKLFP